MITQTVYRFSFLVLSFAIAYAFILKPAHSNFGVLLSDKQTPSRVLLLTAHPDDECLFFAPTILALRGGNTGYTPRESSVSLDVYSLTLSVGNAEGLGGVRRSELEQSLDVLGIMPNSRWSLDKPDLQDNITANWDVQVIADTIKPYIVNNQIDTILTFDYHGISSHPNHKSLPHGVLHLISSLKREQSSHIPRLFSLITVPMLSKYIGPVAALLAKFDLSFASFLEYRDLQRPNTQIPVFVSGWEDYRTALFAMMKHKSQLVWFRWLYVSFSRYMWVNEWVELIPVS